MKTKSGRTLTWATKTMNDEGNGEPMVFMMGVNYNFGDFYCPVLQVGELNRERKTGL
ncbi:MAG: hypothetical protein WD426_03945 [Anditalea sp.]